VILFTGVCGREFLNGKGRTVPWQRAVESSSEQEDGRAPTEPATPNRLANLSKPGATNNPGGRPRKMPQTNALRELCDPDSKLKVPDSEERNVDSIAVAKAQLRDAVEGKPAAFSEVAHRIEGKVRQKMEHSAGAEAIPTVVGRA